MQSEPIQLIKKMREALAEVCVLLDKQDFKGHMYLNYADADLRRFIEDAEEREV